jgi:hypothetical protein
MLLHPAGDLRSPLDKAICVPKNNSNALLVLGMPQAA